MRKGAGMKLSYLGLCGVISLLSYGAMVLFSPLAYPGYDWMCMAVCVSVEHCREKWLRTGVHLFAVMEWLCTVGYGCFPWIADAQDTNIQNRLHLLVTVFVVLFSIVSLIMIFLGTIKNNFRSLGFWSAACLLAMFVGAIGTNVFPQSVFGIFERLSTFSAVVFNAVLGLYLYTGRFVQEGKEE